MRLPPGFVQCDKDREHQFGDRIAATYKGTCPVRGCGGKLRSPCEICGRPTAGEICLSCSTFEKQLAAYVGSEQGLERIRHILEKSDGTDQSLHNAMRLAVLTWGAAFFELGLGGPTFHADGTLDPEAIQQFGATYERVRATCDDS